MAIKKPNLKFPTRVSINITRKCNLKCKHCLSDSGKKDEDELKTVEILDLIDQLKKNGKPTLAIGGGEPLLRRDLFKIIKYARKNEVPVSIITNGLLVNKEIAQKLELLNLEYIAVSIDGLEKTHDAMRGKGNFKKTLKNIKILRKFCNNTKLAMRVTVNTLNIKDGPKLIKLAEKLLFNSIRLAPVLPTGRAKENKNLLITQEQYIQFVKNLHTIKSNIEVIFPDKNHTILLSNKNFGCHCGKEVCWITQTGDLYPCLFFGDNYKAGNIKKENFIVLWNKAKKLAKFCGNKICNNCKNYKNCRGGCRSRALWMYNDINAIDPYCILRKNI